MTIVIKKYYKIDTSRIISDDKTDYIFRVDKNTGNGYLDISELSIFESSYLVGPRLMIEKTRISSDRKVYMNLNPKREGHINEIFLFKITELRLGEYKLF